MSDRVSSVAQPSPMQHANASSRLQPVGKVRSGSIPQLQDHPAAGGQERTAALSYRATGAGHMSYCSSMTSGRIARGSLKPVLSRAAPVISPIGPDPAKTRHLAHRIGFPKPVVRDAKPPLVANPQSIRDHSIGGGKTIKALRKR